MDTTRTPVPRELEPVASFLVEIFAGFTRFGRVMLAIGLVGVTAGILVMLLMDDDEAIIVGGLIMAPFVIPFFVGLSRVLNLRRVEDWAPYRAAILNHQEVVWVYFITADLLVSGVRAGKSRGIAFCDLHGKRHELPLKKKRMETLGPLLRSAYPKATLGWSEQILEAFKRNPASLLRETVS